MANREKFFLAGSGFETMSLSKRTMFRKWIDGHPDMMGWH